MKLIGISWLLKKKVVKHKEVVKCLTCDEPRKSFRAKYCCECSDKRRLENNIIQSSKRYYRKKGVI